MVEQIGMGGMGEVWRAEHRLLARPAAIKLIKGLGVVEAFDPMAEKRFRREADAAASLRSPHTIQLYDFGIARDGRLYYVMELLDGFDLEKLVAGFGPQPPARVAYILRQVCHSLAEAHAAGLVHRDVKPANLHLGRIGLDYDFVKVLDFGLVKGEHRWDREDLRLTSPELTAGTPAYMAPELTSDDHVDGRADLYALGCVGYFLLTGTMVFQADTAVQLLLRHLQTEPEAPSARLGTRLPPDLERLILWCLAKSPDERPPSARDLGEALERSDAGEWTQDQARRWWESSRAENAERQTGATPTPTTIVLEPALPYRVT